MEKQIMTLDEQQKNIVFSSLEGAKLVVAGAGSGKTRVSVETMVQKIKSGVDSSKLIMLTFSRKAEKEMRFRLKVRLEEEGLENKVIVNTYHGFGWSLIRERPDLFCRKDNVTLMDEVDSKKLMYRCAKELEFDSLKSFILSMYEKLSQESLLKTESKRKAIAYIDKKISESSSDDESYITGVEVYAVIEKYQKEKEESNVVDYEDLLLLTVISLETNEDLRKDIQDRFLFLIADEAQDTNEIQYDLVKLIIPKKDIDKKGIMIVGDDDQSIYVWRGARPDNLINFRDDYNAVVFPLERNYRSNKYIVESAVKLISHNSKRLYKKPFSNKDGHKPVSFKFNDFYEMSKYISSSIKELTRKGIKESEIAILYRNNMMSTFIEPMLLAENIQYQVYKGSDFTKRVEIQTAIAFMRLVINPNDYLAFDKITKLMPGIGVSSVAAAYNKSIELGVSIIEGAINAWSDDKKEIAIEWKERIEELSLNSPVILGGWLLNPKGGDFYNYLLNEAGKNADEKKSNIKLNKQIEHLKLLMDTIYNRIDSRKSLNEQWIDALEIMLSSPDDDQEKTGVTLSTIHKSKGLEFKYVYVFGMNGEFFEKRTSLDDEEDAANLEESRRLAYVAMTRAEDVLIICSADKMVLGKMEKNLNPSMFLFESGIGYTKKTLENNNYLFNGVSNEVIFKAVGI